MDQKREEKGSLGLCIVRAEEWLSGLLEGIREKLKSWERSKGKKKVKRKLDTFLLHLGLTNIRCQTKVLFIEFYRGHFMCIHTLLGKKPVSLSAIWWSLK